MDEFDRLITNNALFVRAAGEPARSSAPTRRSTTGWSGRTCAPSGVDFDVRRDVPYSIYPKLKFEVPVGRGLVGTVGDAWDRYWVRAQEWRQSVAMVRQCLEQIDATTPEFWKPPKKLKPMGDAMARVEAARGDMSCYVVGDGGTQRVSRALSHRQLQRDGDHPRKVARADGRGSGGADRVARRRGAGDRSMKRRARGRCSPWLVVAGCAAPEPAAIRDARPTRLQRGERMLVEASGPLFTVGAPTTVSLDALGVTLPARAVAPDRVVAELDDDRRRAAGRDDDDRGRRARSAGRRMRACRSTSSCARRRCVTWPMRLGGAAARSGVAVVGAGAARRRGARRRAVAGDRGPHRRLGAQDLRLHGLALRAQPRRAQRLAAVARRRAQAAHERGHRPHRRRSRACSAPRHTWRSSACSSRSSCCRSRATRSSPTSTSASCSSCR